MSQNLSFVATNPKKFVACRNKLKTPQMNHCSCRWRVKILYCYIICYYMSTIYALVYSVNIQIWEGRLRSCYSGRHQLCPHTYLAWTWSTSIVLTQAQVHICTMYSLNNNIVDRCYCCVSYVFRCFYRCMICYLNEKHTFKKFMSCQKRWYSHAG